MEKDWPTFTTLENKLKKISIVTPCFNEGGGIVKFLESIEAALKNASGYQFHVIVVDDCSLDNSIRLLEKFSFKSSHLSLHLLCNQFNLGHQGSIYQGLLYTTHLEQDYVIIMDSDGEDNPTAIPMLLKKTDYDIVEVKRRKRSESFIFRILYLFYKILFRIISGKTMNYGNFCMLRMNVVEKIKHTSFIHLPAYLLKHGGKRTFIEYDRSARIDGQSKLGYKGLLMHAFKSFVEFGNDLLLWFLRLFGIVFVVLVGISINLFYQKFIAHTAIAGWFSTLFLELLNLAMMCIGFFVLGILLVNLMHHNTVSRNRIYKLIKKQESL